jgi:hypothetical protein
MATAISDNYWEIASEGMSRSPKPRKPHDPAKAGLAAIDKVFSSIFDPHAAPANAPVRLHHYCAAETFPGY